MVGLVGWYWCLHGLCLGFQSERYPHRDRHWHRCPCRLVGSFGHSEKPIPGWCLFDCAHITLSVRFQEHFWRHFVARAVGLVVIPVIVYLSFFWIHFTILTHSGTGDSFMSPRFQESLAGNELLMNSIGKVGFPVMSPCIYICLRAQVLRHHHSTTQRYQGSPTFSSRTLSTALR